MKQRRVPKLCGADIELGNFILGLEREDGTGQLASRALLGEIDGLPRADSYSYAGTGRSTPHSYAGADRNAAYPYSGSYSYAYGGAVYPTTGARIFNPQDWGRKFLSSNGGCCYIDLDHLEICIPEVLSAYDHVAASRAMLRIARDALDAANDKRPRGQRIQVLVNNSDGRSNSYGSHLSFLVTRRAWNEIFERRLHYLVFLASFQASSIVMTGQGKVGGENDAPAVDYQLSQRADFFETLVAEHTTHNRPIVNSRNESLCGESDDLARLHCIFFDSTLCHGSSLLRVGPMQIVLAMIEAGDVDLRMLLEDPVSAVHRWSHDASLQATAPTLHGQAVTAVELQLMFLAAAKRFVERGECEGIVPHAQPILALWEDTLLELQAGNFEALAPRLDWVLKLHLLSKAMQQRPGLMWKSPEIKHLDHLYSSLDPSEGLYWACEDAGAVERLVDDERIDHFVHNPPEDTRAWARAMLLRRIPASLIRYVDWDSISLSAPHGAQPTRIRLTDPLVGRAEMEDRLVDIAAITAAAAPLVKVSVNNRGITEARRTRI